jgi:hypothetical protein
MANDKILLISSPDDVLEEALRILLIDLDKNQSDIVSQCLLSINDLPYTIVYVWKNLEDTSWLFDKSLKSDLIIFNADSENQTLVGYLAAKRNSWYFGQLKTLHIVNKSAIYDVTQCSELLERTLITYGKT